MRAPPEFPSSLLRLPQYVSIPPMIGATADDIAQGNPQPVPGLMDIHTDSSGRHVYAVGAPFFKYDYVAPATNIAPTSYGPGTTLAGPPAQGANVWATAGVLTALYSPSSAVATGSIIVRPSSLRQRPHNLLFFAPLLACAVHVRS